jgi:hypothetical protein
MYATEQPNAPGQAVAAATKKQIPRYARDDNFIAAVTKDSPSRKGLFSVAVPGMTGV